jgi:hypothetical protein
VTTDTSGAIGGYFELDVPPVRGFPLPNAYRFQSARAAFSALLVAGEPDRVWVPRYICDAMLSPLRNRGIDHIFYSICDNFEVEGDIELGEGDWLLYVNYFGICHDQEQRMLDRFGASRVILDRSQAFFAHKVECLAAIYSPRKFFGIPDGGLLSTQLQIHQTYVQDRASADRTRHLLIRLADGPEAGYAEFRRAEQQLDDCEPRQMSSLTNRLLAAIDFDSARRIRTDNFRFLHDRLRFLNSLSITPNWPSGPLSYPFLSPAKARDDLTQNRVYVARYWEEVLQRPGLNDFERSMVTHCLPLPCDQRYGRDDMQKVVDLLLTTVAEGS